MGRISYGLYLYHYPVYHWVGMYSNKDGGATLWTVLFGIALTLVVATLSFLFIEKPLLKFAGRFRKKEPTE